ncbi:hypothetical protein CF65_00489 [Aggregatibacter actinomycetemcomitans HK1651]|nr:hypothetical protein CF65_00489 [Aggregatibacter actinomycetemcomitans HK1651]
MNVKVRSKISMFRSKDLIFVFATILFMKMLIIGNKNVIFSTIFLSFI